LACGARTGMRAPVGLGRRRRSPGRGRLSGGDDTRAPAVSLCGREESGAAALAGRMDRKAKQAGVRGCWAGGAVTASWAVERSGLLGC
jgi:hypothetical protein